MRDDLKVLLERFKQQVLAETGASDARWLKRLGNRYLVTDLGQVYSISTGLGLRRFPRLVRPSHCPRGYAQVILKVDKKPYYHKVHRLVAEAFLGLDPASGKQVHHRDFNPSNNGLSNLEIVSAAENARRSAVAGRRHRQQAVLGALEAL